MNIGLIGTTGHTHLILDGISELKDVRLVGCAMGHPGDDLDKLRNHSAVTGETHFYDDFREMLDKEALDVVGVCRPYSLNAGATLEALERDTHVISEKPVATTLEDLDRLATGLKNSDARLSGMFSMRYYPAFEAAKKAINAGWIGKPVLATAQKSYKFGTRPNFYRSREQYGGTIPWVGIHAVDFVRWTTGLEYVRVAAMHRNQTHPSHPGCEDQAGLLFQLSNGGTAVINIDYLRPDSAPSHGDDRLRVAGSDGIVEVVDCGGRATILRAGEEPKDLDLSEPPGFLADFVKELRGKGTHRIGPDEAVHVTRVCLKARDAADRGEIVEL